MEVPRQGVESDLQVPPYTTTTATPAPSCIYDLCCSLRQCWILSPLSEPGIEPATSWTLSQVLNLLSHNGNSNFCGFKPLSLGSLLTTTLANPYTLLCLCPPATWSSKTSFEDSSFCSSPLPGAASHRPAFRQCYCRQESSREPVKK